MKSLQHFLARAKEATTNFITRAKHAFTRAEAISKTALVIALGGGATAVADAIHQAQSMGQFIGTLEHLTLLKAKFLTGAGIAVFFWLCNSPQLHTKQQ